MEPTITPGQVEDAIRAVVERNGLEECYIRPVVYRGYNVLGLDPRPCPIEIAVAAWPWGRYLGEGSETTGVDIRVSSWRRMAPDTLPAMAKCAGNYVNSALIVAEAKRHGYDEGLALDVDGYVAEGSGQNLFLVQDGILHTPPVGASILAGVTRACVLQLARDLGIPAVEQRLPREMLHTADEAFFSGTVAEVTPIRSVDGKPVGSGTRGPITQRIQERYFAIARGESEDRHAWLTPVRA
jgi:branched-chain amino acid aminotransferase